MLLVILGKIAAFLFIGRPAQQRVIDQRVLHVNNHAGGSIHARNFFHGQDRLKKPSSSAAVLLRNFYPHQPKLEELIDQIVIKNALLVHLTDFGAEGLVGKLAHVVAK